MNRSSIERTAWRDEEISLRHRTWGVNCPAVDLDFVLVEYHLGQPVALIEYKHHAAPLADLAHPTYRALALLATTASVPFIIARYWPDTWAMHLRPGNPRAQVSLSGEQWLSEREFVILLHRLRSAAIAAEVLPLLHTEKPPQRHLHLVT